MFRKGQWVVYEGHAGIHVKTEGGLAEVHIVDDEGYTIAITTVEVMRLRQAAINEIPAKRRPREQLAAMLQIPGTVETAKARAAAARSQVIRTQKVMRPNALTRFVRALRGSPDHGTN